MKIADRYLARQTVAGTLLVLLVLTAIASVVTFVGELGSVGQGHYTLAAAALYTLLYVPVQAYGMLPVATLVGAMLALGDLASHNELMVLRTAGVSAARIGRATLSGGVLLLALCVLLGEVAAPPAQRYAEARRAALTGYNPSSVVGGVWAKDGPLFVNVRQLGSHDAVRGIYIFRVNAARQLQSVAMADSASFSDGAWRLQGVRETRLTADGASARTLVSSQWRTFLTPALLSLFTVDPDSLSARGLYQYVRYLHANGLNADRYIAAFWARVAEPVSLLVMLLLALPFVLGPLRSASAGQRLVTGMLIGIAFYVFNSVFLQSGVVFGLNPVFTAWFPTALLAAASIVAVGRVR